jgi:alpha-beta hydrolase superfamily lysophospholipase
VVKRWTWAFLVGAVLSLSSCALARRALVGGSPSTVGAAPPALGATGLTFASASGAVLHAWFARGQRGGGAVVLLHGVHADRRAMLDRAEFLHGRGYTVLMPDFRAHGESSGESTTFGGLESRDALASVCLARQLVPDERVGVIGVSMGGAAALLGDRPLPVDALVVESVYSTIDRAIRNRLRAWFGLFGRPLTGPVLRWLEPSLPVRPSDLRPIDRIGQVSAPVLVAAGTEDRYTTIDETRALFAHAREPKQLWEVQGAGHVDLHGYAPAEYEQRVGGFLDGLLRSDSSGAQPAARIGEAEGVMRTVRSTSCVDPANADARVADPPVP